MTTADDILEMLRDDILDHGFFVQCIADGGSNATLDSQEKALLTDLLSSGKVEIGTAKLAGPNYTEIVAWRGTVEERVRRAMNAVSNAVGHDKQFAYWLCLRENVDRYE